MKGQTGGSLGGRVTLSKRRQRSRAKARKREEQRWAELNGPVISYVDESVRRDAQDQGDDASVPPGPAQG